MNLEPNVIIESQDVKFFKNLIMSHKEYEIPTNEEPREEGSPQIVETQPKLRRSKRVWKTNDLRPNKIDSRLISFYQVKKIVRILFVRFLLFFKWKMMKENGDLKRNGN